jgi:uncharacterized protein (TIGR02246 family)
MKRIGLILLAACLSVLAQQENKSDPALTEARKAIDKGNSQWIEAWDKADASLIAALFAEDGILMRRNGKMSKGPKEVFEAMKPVLESVGKGAKATVNTVDLWLDGATAYETGTYSYKYQENGKPVTDEGRYVTIWRRQSDGTWKIIGDMGVPKN